MHKSVSECPIPKCCFKLSQYNNNNKVLYREDWRFKLTISKQKLLISDFKFYTRKNDLTFHETSKSIIAKISILKIQNLFGLGSNVQQMMKENDETAFPKRMWVAFHIENKSNNVTTSSTCTLKHHSCSNRRFCRYLISHILWDPHARLHNEEVPRALLMAAKPIYIEEPNKKLVKWQKTECRMFDRDQCVWY